MMNSWPEFQNKVISLVLLASGIVVISCSLFTVSPTPFVELTEMVFDITQTPSPVPTVAYMQESETLIADGLSITVLEHKLEGCYTSKYNNEQCPSRGAALLWVHIKRENVRNSSDMPIYSCFWFQLLYRENELETSYFHDNHAERENWNSGGCGQLYSGNSDEGWVSFEVPEGIELVDALFRIESYQGPELEQVWKLSK